MKTNNYPWRNCRSIKLLRAFYLPTVGIVGLLPAILIMNHFENNYFILAAAIYCLSVQRLYLLLIHHVDIKLEKKWLETNKQ